MKFKNCVHHIDKGSISTEKMNKGIKDWLASIFLKCAYVSRTLISPNSQAEPPEHHSQETQ